MRWRNSLSLGGIVLVLCLVGCQDQPEPTASEPTDIAPLARFNWFEYRGEDDIFAEPLAEDEFQNPIIAGFYPDPSIVRVDDDYYMIHSSFAWSPGIPIFHSRDLVNWDKLGHVLTRPDQLLLDERQVSEGIFAPTIRYHDGTFYVISTGVWAGGNFIVTAKDPAGPWSDPIWLPEVGGIDPDIFFDDDGRIYIAHNDGPPDDEPLYEGHRALWLWEYDPEARAVIPPRRLLVDGGVTIEDEPVWIEAPHIFKHNDWYYLTAAEGGTGHEHSQVIFRSRSLDEPFEAYANNPILTQRDLPVDRDNAINSAGHADFVQLPDGDWWAVFLATRTYEGRHHNTGRETFLLPVAWEDDWPIILRAQTEVPMRLTRPDLPKWDKTLPPRTGNFTWRDDFDTAQLAFEWSRLRVSESRWYRQREGQLILAPQRLTLADRAQPSFLARRQAHGRYQASTELQLPMAEGMSAGLAVFQNESHHYYLGLERASEDGYRLFLEQAAGESAAEIATTHIEGARAIELFVVGDQGDIGFYYRVAGQAERQRLAENLDGRVLSTAVAGGFVGAHIGVHARIEKYK
ncbi:glycoside hydrolase family 43 protein [Marinimicrobium alkaliphilum]|uniref:glycoside hydrolase family 43 protein n=1 Tax=Marinimicrobium alkaliphilum TaxID=2202654 RepID=UPI000DB9980D|nr:glycoside hydrolase family 43 protein [Marinimicrobium alkaliphilum]